MDQQDNISRRAVLRYGAVASGIAVVGSTSVGARPSSSEGGMGFMTTRGTGKIEPGDHFYFNYKIDGMQWRIDPDCDGGTDYELFQNWSIKDEDGQTAGLLLPVDRDVTIDDEGGGWHVFQVIQDDCGISPDDGANRPLQKIQFKPMTGQRRGPDHSNGNGR